MVNLWRTLQDYKLSTFNVNLFDVLLEKRALSQKLGVKLWVLRIYKIMSIKE